MVADTSKFSGVNEKRLRVEMAERKQAVENMISDTGRLKACAQKKVSSTIDIIIIIIIIIIFFFFLHRHPSQQLCNCQHKKKN
jgi:uncharacterized membrane protein YvbJ